VFKCGSCYSDEVHPVYVGDREEISVHHLHCVLREAEINRAVG